MPGTILFVDDEDRNCFMVSNLFRHYGYNIITAETVDVALDSSEWNSLDVIVLDVNLAERTALSS